MQFKNIPGIPIAYWMSKNMVKLFSHDTIAAITISDGQTKTGDNGKYIRNLWEVSSRNIGKNNKWVKHPKGGSFRRWYGNTDSIIDWSQEAREHYKTDHVARILPEYLWWKKGISWTLIGSGKRSFRDYDDQSIFNLAAPTIFFNREAERIFTLGLLNTPIAEFLLKIFNPTLNTNIGEVQAIPLIMDQVDNVNVLRGLL